MGPTPPDLLPELGLSHDRLQSLTLLLDNYALEYRVDEYAETHIDRHPFAIRISMRPDHCDRGAWLLHAESIDVSLAVIDHDDRFPRYYFNTVFMVGEMMLWLDKRMLYVDRKLKARARASDE